MIILKKGVDPEDWQKETGCPTCYAALGVCAADLSLREDEVTRNKILVGTCTYCHHIFSCTDVPPIVKEYIAERDKQ